MVSVLAHFGPDGLKETLKPFDRAGWPLNHARSTMLPGRAPCQRGPACVWWSFRRAPTFPPRPADLPALPALALTLVYGSHPGLQRELGPDVRPLQAPQVMNDCFGRHDDLQHSRLVA